MCPTFEVRFPAEAREFSLHHSVQTVYGAHLASLSLEVKRSGA
jgi:hypothetical protein